MKSARLVTIVSLVVLGVMALWVGYPHASASLEPAQESTAESGESVIVQYIGHSSYLITAPDGTRIVTDPYSGLPYPFPEGIEADVVTVSHAHTDHNNYMAVEGKPEVITTVTIAQEKLVQAGMVTITGYRTQHGGSTGLITIFVFQIGDVKLVHLGASDLIPDPETRDAIKDADVVFVDIASISLDQIMPLMQQINARTVIPGHYSLDADNLFFGAPTVDEFLAVVPPDMPVVQEEDGEIAVTPGMPTQVVVMSRYPFESAVPTPAPTQEATEEAVNPVTVQYIGLASFLITAPDGTRIITDPFDAIPNPVPSMPLPFPYGLAADVVTVSQAHPDHNNYTAVGGNPEVLSTVTMVNEKLVKVGMVDITGYRTWTGTTSPGFNTNFVYQIGDVKLVHLGESGPITDPRVTDPQSIIDALKGADVVFVPLNSLRMDDQIMPLLDAIDAHTIVPMHFSESPDVRYRRGATIEEFLAVVPPDMTVVTGVETLEVTPGMPYQIVVMSRTPFESN